MSLPGIAEGVRSQGEWQPERLIAGTFPRITRIATLEGTTPLTPGAVLGRIQASGAYVLSDASATDGSQVPDAVLMEPVDLQGSPAQGHVYLTGEFNALMLNFGPGHTLASVTDAFRERALFLRQGPA